jgi:Cdc6-like AAA superfamily ATPase
MLTILLLFISTSIYIIWSMPLLALLPFGITLNKLSGRKLAQFLTKHVSYASIYSNNEPGGWICGKGFIGYIHESVSQHGASTKDLYIFIGTKRLKQLTEGSEINEIPKKRITFIERDGFFWNLTYPERLIDPPTELAWPWQTKVINEIIEYWQQNKYATVLLTGASGTGKSHVPLQLCSALLQTHNKVTLVDTWNPTEPGDTLASIYNKVNPSFDEPLVVVLEEIDGLIFAMHNNNIQISKSFPTPIQIKNKTDWNQFLDRFDRKMYLGVILCFTSNKPLKWFNDIDSSYMRPGRINIQCEIDNSALPNPTVEVFADVSEIKE